MGIQHDSYWEEEERAISEFLAAECKCGLDAGKSCSRQFGRDVYIQVRGDCSELSHNELDVCIINKLSACVSDSSETARSTPRKFSYAGLRHRGKRVCMKTFMFMHGIGGWRMRALKATMLERGIVQRVHGNTKRLPHNTLSFDGTQRVVAFISFYAEEHAILLPGHVPGYKRADVQLLPTHTTKKNVWRQYCASGNGDGVSYCTFCRLWNRLLPHILITKPMADLCWVCQKNATAVMRSANLSEAAKSRLLIIMQMACVNVCCVQGSKCLQTCVHSSLHTTTGVFMQDAVYEHSFPSVLIECGDLPAAPPIGQQRTIFVSFSVQ